jgi:hypothetical protein
MPFTGQYRASYGLSLAPQTILEDRRDGSLLVTDSAGFAGGFGLPERVTGLSNAGDDLHRRAEHGELLRVEGDRQQRVAPLIDEMTVGAY